MLRAWLATHFIFEKEVTSSFNRQNSMSGTHFLYKSEKTMHPSENVPDLGRRASRPSLIVTRVVPLMIAIQVLLTLVIYPFLPNIVPSHWNAAGQIDSYEAKWVFVGFLPILSLILYAMLGAFFAFRGPRSSSQDQSAQQMEVSPAQAAVLIGKSERTIQQYIRDGKLSARYLADGRYVVNLNELAMVHSDQAGSNEGAKMILKFVMLMQQAIFLITQVILLVLALHAGSGAAH
ncbi:MAG: hypothetical protein NVSMB38_26790 [Ktedonobacteraceae bacterium]